MRKSLLTGTLAVALATMAGPALASDADFILINKTNIAFNEVYLSTTGDNDWDEDILGDDTLEPNKSATMEFEPGGDCKVDVKVVDVKHHEHIFRNVDLCKLVKLTISGRGDNFHWDGSR